ncbi:ATPase, T2SS/T4P/T4SS family [Erysipelothrix urinaevulpis]|uniref:ATPase, T2SS/T4P/T4SS family n=1 Tax=Erysipelothrix urinaevulpis TaxID=2683717 RepID=UPI00135BFCE9|nr:ATPase, T2SS/T4P/T4SS family [Erysipelothrix urinaevulpis]
MKHTHIQFNELLNHMIKQKISDCHFNFSKSKQTVTLRRHKKRIEGDTNEWGLKVFDFLKFKSKLDLNINEKPQTGVFEYYHDNHVYFCRFALLESYYRKSAVLRILNLKHFDSFESLTKGQLTMQTLQKIQHGIILFCGITGSGKSTTQFYFLKSLKEKQCYIIENPIEIVDEQLTQIDLQTQSLSIDEIVSQLLRHDPDVISLGEVRSSHELGSLIRAGLSGHMVTTTLHSGSIEQTIARLLDLGAKPYEIEHVLQAIVFQTLTINQKGEVIVDFKVYRQKEIKQKLQSKGFI